MVNVGIDIGTSNTVVAVVRADGKAEVVNFPGGYAVPSVVYIDPTAGRRVVGRPAEDEWADPESQSEFVFRRWKLRMGEGATLATLPFGRPEERAITPERLTTLLVEHVAGALAGGVGGEEIESVVVTVPHGWRREHPDKCVATREAAGAAQVAGERLRVQERAVDEPVAAAAYWLSEVPNRDEFVGRTVLVVDLGGGTFDLSLVEVGREDTPLVVVDAINNNTAGDFATAILLGKAVAVLNEQTRSKHPTEPEVLLTLLAHAGYGWLRRAFLDMQNEIHAQSYAIWMAQARGRQPGEASRPVELTGPDGTRISFRQSALGTLRLLEPFYESGRHLLRRFLGLQDKGRLPHAVVFAGGGSRIGGVASEIVRPVFEEVFAEAGLDAAAVFDRSHLHELNKLKIDQAIALGAALVAAGRVSIEERLLFDIGMVFHVPAAMAALLGLGAERQLCLVSPLLPRGSVLPVSFQTARARFPQLIVPALEHLEYQIVVFDDPSDPWLRTWTSDNPADGIGNVDVEVHANADGILNVTVRTAEGESVSVSGELQRNRRLLAPKGLAFAPAPGGDLPPVVTPDQIAALGRGRRADA